MSSKIKTTVLLSLLILHTVGSAGDMTLEVIPLKHRNADDVVQILRPLVAPGGTITGMENQLVIKTTTDNLAEIRNVLQSLDRSPRRLLITVKQDIGGYIERRENSLSGKYSSGDVTVSTGDLDHDRDGLVISGKDDEGNVIRYRTLDRSTHSDDKNTFRVQALEGHHAFIQSGQSVPVRDKTAYVTPEGVVVTDHTEYHDATSGFYVLPRLNGDNVTLLVAPRLTRVTPGKRPVFDVQSVETTASGKLGEWMHIGGINQGLDERDSRNLSSSTVHSQQSRSVLIKVDEIK